MERAHHTLLLAGLVAFVAVAACGGSATPTPAAAGAGSTPATTPPVAATAVAGSSQAPGAVETAPVIDACALLPDATIEKATGHAPTSSDGSRPTGIFPAGCTWVLPADSIKGAPTVVLGVLMSGGATAYQEYIAPFGVEYGYEPISGLGDAASDVGGGGVLVLRGDTLFELDYVALQPTDTEIATKLAQDVLANLPE